MSGLHYRVVSDLQRRPSPRALTHRRRAVCRLTALIGANPAPDLGASGPCSPPVGLYRSREEPDGGVRVLVERPAAAIT